LPLLGIGGLLARIEGRRIRKDRITPADQDVSIVTLGDVMILIHAAGEFCETETG
jgi:hypothetical protein